jgi:hypothetical protein
VGYSSGPGQIACMNGDTKTSLDFHFIIYILYTLCICHFSDGFSICIKNVHKMHPIVF